MRLTLALTFLLAWLVSCTTGPSGACQNPVLDACSQKAQEVSAELSQIAAQQNLTPEEITNEFVNACEGQLQADLDQTLAALQAIVDAGAIDTSKGDAQ